MTNIHQSQSRSTLSRLRSEISSALVAPHDVTITHSEFVASNRPPIDREQLVAKAAYQLAVSRGFAPGHELDDWLSAEAEVDARIWSEGRRY